MKYLEDSRLLVDRNHDARGYSYKCRDKNHKKWHRISVRDFSVASVLFITSILMRVAL